MRYFKKNLLRSINSVNVEEREKAISEWSKNDILYYKKFQKIKDAMPREFITIFLDCYGFHDYKVTGINFENKKNESSCIIGLSNSNGEVYRMVINGVSFIHVNLQSLDSLICGELNWGYCEFSLTADKHYIMDVLFDINNSMRIKFLNILVT